MPNSSVSKSDLEECNDFGGKDNASSKAPGRAVEDAALRLPGAIHIIRRKSLSPRRAADQADAALLQLPVRRSEMRMILGPGARFAPDGIPPQVPGRGRHGRSVETHGVRPTATWYPVSSGARTCGSVSIVIGEGGRCIHRAENRPHRWGEPAGAGVDGGTAGEEEPGLELMAHFHWPEVWDCSRVPKELRDRSAAGPDPGVVRPWAAR